VRLHKGAPWSLGAAPPGVIAAVMVATEAQAGALISEVVAVESQPSLGPELIPKDSTFSFRG
jgi:hypothetical protein